MAKRGREFLSFYIVILAEMRYNNFYLKKDGEDTELNQKIKGIIHNAFYTRNERKESLKCLDGLTQSADMDMYDYEFDEDGALIAIHKKVLTE